MRSITAIVALVLLTPAITSAVSAEPPQLYWTDTDGFITRAELDGSGVSDVLTLSGQGLRLSLDPVDNAMYWTQSGDTFLRRANLDGTNTQVILDFGQYLPDFDIDPIGRRLYWRQRTPDAATIIARAGLDGTDVATIATLTADGSGFISVDPLGKNIYWTTEKTGAFGFTNVRRMNFDGSSIEVIASGRRYSDIKVDPIGQKVYWVTIDASDRRIQRANLDGSGLEDILPDTLDFSDFPGYVHMPRTISVDPVGQRIYWVNDQFRDDRVMSARLDGTDITQLYSSPRSGVNAIRVLRFPVPEPSSMLLMVLGGSALCGWLRTDEKHVMTFRTQKLGGPSR